MEYIWYERGLIVNEVMKYGMINHVGEEIKQREKKKSDFENWGWRRNGHIDILYCVG